MKQKPAGKAPRRVKIGYDFEKCAQMKNDLYDICFFANTHIIPALEALGTKVTLPAVIRYTQEPELMRADYIAQNIQPVNNPVLDKIMSEKLSENFGAIVSLPLRGERVRHTEFLRLEPDEGRTEDCDGDKMPQRLTYDIKAVINSADIYITDPAELDAYDRHQKAVEAMNEFFNGTAAGVWEEPLHYFFVPDPEKPGYMKAAEMRSYKRFIKK